MSANGPRHKFADDDDKAEYEYEMKKKRENQQFRKNVNVRLKDVKDKKVRSRLKSEEYRRRNLAQQKDNAKLLLPSESGMLEAEKMEKTYHFRQTDLREEVDEQTRRSIFSLRLELGPYLAKYSQNGSSLLLTGYEGHAAIVDWRSKKLKMEVHVKDTIRDSIFLHNSTLFATAQSKYVYIYDQSGAEIHCLRRHMYPTGLEMLPYHFLLASVGESGYLKYQDVSTGDLLCEHRTKLGPSPIIRQNPTNAIIQLGHHNGTVSLWSPNMSRHLVKFLAHRGNITSLAVDRSGTYLASAGQDGQVRVTDLRMYKELYSYGTLHPPKSLDISQKGVLGLCYGNSAMFWKDISQKLKDPYLCHRAEGSTLTSLRFVPFEDVVGIGLNSGMDSIVVPGSGDPNFDSYENNPFETLKQRKETEVHKLLEKIPANLISLSPCDVGAVDVVSAEVKRQEKTEWLQSTRRSHGTPTSNKAKGPSDRKPTRSAIRKAKSRKKHGVVIREHEKSILHAESNKKDGRSDDSRANPSDVTALDRFFGGGAK